MKSRDHCALVITLLLVWASDVRCGTHHIHIYFNSVLVGLLIHSQEDSQETPNTRIEAYDYFLNWQAQSLGDFFSPDKVKPSEKSWTIFRIKTKGTPEHLPGKVEVWRFSSAPIDTVPSITTDDGHLIAQYIGICVADPVFSFGINANTMYRGSLKLRQLPAVPEGNSKKFCFAGWGPEEGNLWAEDYLKENLDCQASRTFTCTRIYSTPTGSELELQHKACFQTKLRNPDDNSALRVSTRGLQPKAFFVEWTPEGTSRACTIEYRIVSDKVTEHLAELKSAALKESSRPTENEADKHLPPAPPPFSPPHPQNEPASQKRCCAIQ